MVRLAARLVDASQGAGPEVVDVLFCGVDARCVPVDATAVAEPWLATDLQNAGQDGPPVRAGQALRGVVQTEREWQAELAGAVAVVVDDRAGDARLAEAGVACRWTVPAVAAILLVVACLAHGDAAAGPAAALAVTAVAEGARLPYLGAALPVLTATETAGRLGIARRLVGLAADQRLVRQRLAGELPATIDGRDAGLPRLAAVLGLLANARHAREAAALLGQLAGQQIGHTLANASAEAGAAFLAGGAVLLISEALQRAVTGVVAVVAAAFVVVLAGLALVRTDGPPAGPGHRIAWGRAALGRVGAHHAVEPTAALIGAAALAGGEATAMLFLSAAPASVAAHRELIEAAPGGGAVGQAVLLPEGGKPLGPQGGLGRFEGLAQALLTVGMGRGAVAGSEQLTQAAGGTGVVLQIQDLHTATTQGSGESHQQGAPRATTSCLPRAQHRSLDSITRPLALPDVELVVDLGHRVLDLLQGLTELALLPLPFASVWVDAAPRGGVDSGPWCLRPIALGSCVGPLSASARRRSAARVLTSVALFGLWRRATDGAVGTPPAAAATSPRPAAASVAGAGPASHPTLGSAEGLTCPPPRAGHLLGGLEQGSSEDQRHQGQDHRHHHSQAQRHADSGDGETEHDGEGDQRR